MSRPATSRPKLNPPLGLMPALQYLLPAQLEIDATYQRSLEAGPSQALIRRIAQHWNWDLCQPLVVARREDGRLFVIDGQHRLEAARLRGDIPQLPAVVVQYASAADEAASFVHLNQQRRPLSKLDLFKAAVASGDGEATAIVAAMEQAGLSVAPHQNYISWKPGMVANIGGIESAWRRHGPAVTETAMRVLAQAWAGQVLRYAGSLFPGIAAVCSDEMRGRDLLPGATFEQLVLVIGRSGQTDWRRDIMRAKADNPMLKFEAASAKVVLTAWAKANGREPPAAAPPPPRAVAASPAPLGPFSGTRWCEQCDMKISHAELQSCRSRWCSLKAFG